MIIIPAIAGMVALIVAGYLTLKIVREPMGTPKMQEICEAIREGSKAYLRRQYKTIAVIAIILTIILFFVLGYKTALAFLIGASFSLLAGYVGMDVATRSNARTAYATRSGVNKPLKIAFYGGLVMGLFNVGLSLLAVTGLFYFYGYNHEAPTMIVGLGFGASLAALFAQLGGGIFTKAADVGADLVGKVEQGIPEDDPRNPAVIADNVGDNVGDVAGRGADLFESMVGENIGAMIIGASLFLVTKNFYFIIFPLLARALGIFATILAVPVVNARKNLDPMVPLRNGIIATIIIAIIGFYFLVMWTLKSLNLYFANLAGLIASILILLVTEYYTSRKYRPVQSIANASKTGSATNVITGFSVSLEATALPVVIISIALLFAYYFGTLFAHETGINAHLGGIYGTAVATMGMLSIAGMVLGLDGFGPIADNAAGIIEMSGEGEEAKKSIDAFDAVGNTTKALTKGYAMGSAGLASLLLFQAYLEVTKLSIVDIAIPKIVVGLFIGVLLPFIFSSFAIRAVGRAAFKIVEEVRRQFKTIPGIMTGEAKPDYSKAIDISTLSAQKEMIIPGLLVLLVPIAIGFLLGAEAAGAFLMGATLSGFTLAMMMNSGGAALDNAKKFIEAGAFGGKGSEAHKAAVVGDTFGDPMKDTAGPSLHILIKLINTISLVFGPLFLLYALRFL